MTRESDLARRSTEIRRFFRSTTSNKPVVSQFLHDVELEMKEYQVEINRLKTAIYAIESKRDKLKRTADLYKSLLSPIHTMPSEILSMIFAIFCKENVLSRSTLPEALRLSMVCGRWRDIVYSAPRLWSSIRIDFRAWTKDFHILDELTEHFMKKSGSSPLRLSLTFSAKESNDAQSAREGSQIALKTLVGHCERWENVFLTVAPTYFPSSIFNPIRGRLPLLVSLDLDREGDDAAWELVFDYFAICPALRTLCISPQLFEPEEVSLPWDQVVSLQMKTSFNTRAFPLLSLCPRVEHLEVCRIGGQGDDANDYLGHIISSSVKTLNITACDQADVDGTLQHTTLREISSLSICGRHDFYAPAIWPKWNELHLQSFLQRSSCRISSLTLKCLPITSEQMISLLRMIPTIESLCIEELHQEHENRIVTRTFLDSFAAGAPAHLPSSTPLIPRLTDLRLVVHVKHLESETFLKALSSRWAPDPTNAVEIDVACLRSVAIVVILNDGDKEGDLDGLLCFADAGVRLSITYGTLSESYSDDDEGGLGGTDGNNEGEGVL
ncbi:hypothetical protein V5O48_011881 [Marasmius crinis-equi]|uniref:F-box domain-containing protein n=1 Tax=Marasmius crinis-equi TaxID=585013 RepID=A0ABR3F4E8_9AGAR